MDTSGKISNHKNGRQVSLTRKSHIFLYLIIILVFFCFGILWYNFHTYDQYMKNYDACLENCKILGDALNDYSDQHDGHYPEKMEMLVPEYIFAIPTCPEAGRDTYSESYGWYEGWNSCKFCCKGKNHRGYVCPLSINGISLFGKIAPTEDKPRFNSLCGVVKE